MRRSVAVATLIIAGGVFGAADADAQSAILNLPLASPHARVMQRIGITDIPIDYHRPLVGGRKILGGLRPMGGLANRANNNTTIEVSDPVAVEGQPLPKGVYALHMIPGEAPGSSSSPGTRPLGQLHVRQGRRRPARDREAGDHREP